MIEGYRQLLNDIQLHKRLKDLAENEYKYNQDLFKKNKSMNTRATISNKPIDRIVEDLRLSENMILIEDERIKYLEEQKRLIDECINNSDITVKVAQLRAMGLTQEQVAELVERSTSTIKRIDKKLKNDTLNELSAIDKS